MQGIASPDLYWYRQLPGGWLALLAYSGLEENVANMGPHHIKARRPKASSFFMLSITDFSVGDTGVYYCAWRPTHWCKCVQPSYKNKSFLA